MMKAVYNAIFGNPVDFLQIAVEQKVQRQAFAKAFAEKAAQYNAAFDAVEAKFYA